MTLAKIEFSRVVDLPKTAQAALSNSFLFNLTIAVRDIMIADPKNLKEKWFGVNQIFHMTIPFIDSLTFGHRSSYTFEIIINNIEDIGERYDIERYVIIAWQAAQKSIELLGEDM